LVEWGGKVTRTVPLSAKDNMICLAMGSFCLFWGLLVKLALPSRFFVGFSFNEDVMTEIEEKESVTSVLRGSHRSNSVKSQRSTKSNHEKKD
jgi:hypothetical protein